MKPPCIPKACLHWLLNRCKCQYRVDLKRGEIRKKFFSTPYLGKRFPQDTKDQSLHYLARREYLCYTPSSQSCSKTEYHNRSWAQLPLNTVILGNTGRKSGEPEIIALQPGKEATQLRKLLAQQFSVLRLVPVKSYTQKHLTPFHSQSDLFLAQAPNGLRSNSNYKKSKCKLVTKDGFNFKT